MLQLGKLQIASIGIASILAAYAAAASFASQGVVGQVVPEMQYADAANVDYFLKIEGVDGESTSAKHKGEIEILSFSWGVSQQGSSGTGGGGGAGKATFQDISFVKNLDKSSPLLFVKTATGEHIKEVVLTGEIAGKRGEKFLEIKMSEVLISSYQQSGSEGGVPTDTFSLNFAKIEFKYYPVDKSGSLGGPVTGGWDLKENKEA